MSRKERTRLEVMARVRDGQVSVVKAAELLELSLRQTRRIVKRYRKQGDAGLMHGLRGKPGNRALEASVKQLALKLYREKYADFGPTLACEHLKADGQEVRRETLWRWLLAEGLWSKCRRRKKHRSRRERKAHCGEMVQMDGSHHDWFEGRGAWCVLMVIIDDATGRTFARFFEGETTAAAFDVFGGYVGKHGVPRSLYVDRDSIYRSDRQATVEEELRSEGPLTQFGRAMKTLGVRLILANSPQAKGRVERMNGTLQDRLVKEMRLAKISDIASANRFLSATFLPKLNRQFAVEPKQPSDLHRKLEAGVRLDEVLCFCEERTVSADWCVQWCNRIFQLDKRHESLALAGRKLTVRQKLKGQVELVQGKCKLKFKELPGRPRRAEPKRLAITNNLRWRPSPKHPWQRSVPRVNPAPAAPTRDLHAEKKETVTVLLQ